MFGYSKVKSDVFTLPPKEVCNAVAPKVKVDTKLLRMDKLTPLQWQRLKQSQGWLGVLYLRLRYGSADTYILLAYVEEELAHVEWIVPHRKIKSRYPFVSKDSYSIISCLTLPKYRGLGIYPSQIRKVVESDLPARMLWIWTASTNIPSINGIHKAGAIKVAEFVQKKWLWGSISRVEFFPEQPSNQSESS